MNRLTRLFRSLGRSKGSTETLANPAPEPARGTPEVESLSMEELEWYDEPKEGFTTRAVQATKSRLEADKPGVASPVIIPHPTLHTGLEFEQRDTLGGFEVPVPVEDLSEGVEAEAGESEELVSEEWFEETSKLVPQRVEPLSAAGEGVSPADPTDHFDHDAALVAMYYDVEDAPEGSATSAALESWFVPEAEFDPNPGLKAPELELTAPHDAKTLKAEKMARELATRYNWSQAGREVLTELFLDHPYSATQRAVERYMEAGLPEGDFKTAVAVRKLWLKYPEFAALADYSPLHYSPYPSWELAATLGRHFYQNDQETEEIELSLLALHNRWWRGSLAQTYASFQLYLAEVFRLPLHQ